MYLRFCEKNNYKYEIIDEQKGEEAGIKSVTVLIKGFCAYGYFKCEKGVHERSQIKNKETAMKVLKSKLYQLELEKQELELNKIKGINSNIDFGSQIRSYVLEPYTLVKDSRTNYETAQADKVLDGDIMPFILAMLKNKIS